MYDEDIDNVHREIVTSIKKFKQSKILESCKQSKILESCLFKGNYQLSKDIIENTSHLDLIEISKHELIKRLSKHIVDKHVDDITESKEIGGNRYYLELLILKYQDLKQVVEYCIKTMPLEAIEEIRK